LLAVVAVSPALAAGERRDAATARARAVPLMGVNVADINAGPLSDADRAVADALALHAGVIRTRVPWSVLQPTGPGSLDVRSLAFMDRIVSDAATHGIRVLVFADSAPCWASSAPPSVLHTCAPGAASNANAWPPRNPADYASFVAYIAQRYGTRLAAIEIWNEPDHSNEHHFNGPEKPQRYAALVRAAYPAIKRANPSVPVLAGSLVGSNGVFLRALYGAGIKGFYDGLAVHYYTLTLGSVRAIHEAQLANQDTTPLWLDEFGWPSCYPRLRIEQEQACVSGAIQSANLSDTIRALARAPYVAAVVSYNLHDSSSEDFGAVSLPGARKPSFFALAHAFSAPFGRVSRVTLQLRRRGGHVVASGSGPVGDYMQLEAFRGSVLRYRALFTLDRFNRYSIVLPAALGTRGLRVRVFQYWQGVGKAAQRRI
jgi:hypothetical protein